MNILQRHFKPNKKDRISNSSYSIHARKKQSGSALIVVLLLVLVGSLIAISQAKTTRTDMKIAHNNQLGVQALGVAEAGIYHAFRLIADNSTNLDNEIDSGGTGGALATLANITALDGINYQYVPFGGTGATDGYYIKAEDNFDETPNDADDDTDLTIDILSHGKIATAERAIKVRVRKGFGFGLFGKREVRLSGSAYVGSYDPLALGGLPSNPPASYGNLAQVGSNVIINAGTGSIYGDASVPPALATDAEGNVSSGTVMGSGTINNIVTDAEVQNFPSVPACGAFTDLASVGATGFGTYDPLIGNVNVGGSGLLTLPPGDYCFNQFTLSGSSTIEVTGPVEISLVGAGDFSGTTFTNIGSSPLPSDIKIFSSGANLTVSGGSGVAVSLYAPDAIINISGSSTFYGVAIGAEVEISGSASFMVDESLLPTDLEIISWREVRNN